ncbi:unnamed protein product [Symbiodinium pilosum]|uniref:Uncharacterized protein n=1 Tax=Symbiodinium pilosum TaxID=2952 RepID=A0A812TBH4_SYMPI|nr:unnamed protein product [Symbiodinium pilosum]
MGLPKPLPMGSLEEPMSYVNASRELEQVKVPEEPMETEGARIAEVISEKLETLKLVKDDSLRESLSAEVCAEEAAHLVVLQQSGKTAVVHHIPGDEQWRSFYQPIEDCSSYTPDVMMMSKMKGYFLDMGGLVEDQEAMLAKKQRFMGVKRLKTEPALGSLE